MSKLRRDRTAMRWARYTRRNEKNASAPWDTNGTWGSYRAMDWMIDRKHRGTIDIYKVIWRIAPLFWYAKREKS